MALRLTPGVVPAIVTTLCGAWGARAGGVCGVWSGAGDGGGRLIDTSSVTVRYLIGIDSSLESTTWQVGPE